MFSRRTILSLYQFLSLQELNFVSILLEKHELYTFSIEEFYKVDLEERKFILINAKEANLYDLLIEITNTRRDLRNRVSPKYRFDERWADLAKCLELDGYLIKNKEFIRVDPSIEGVVPIEDDLLTELERSGLNSSQDIIQLLNKSTDDFKKEPSDYNGCLTNSRVALETLAKDIAQERSKIYPDNLDKTKWGSAIDYLERSGMITDNETVALTGVYKFLSAGAHRPIGLSEREMARLGRNLAASMCYFLVKIHNETKTL